MDCSGALHKVGQQVGTKQAACALAQSGEERPCAVVGQEKQEVGKKWGWYSVRAREIRVRLVSTGPARNAFPRL